MKNPVKKIAILTSFFVMLFMFSSAQAQHGSGMRKFDENKEKIKAHKVAYITDKLDLTPAEAEKFWPLYNEHESKVEKERKDFRQKHEFDHDQIMDLSDQDAAALIDAQSSHEQQMLDLDRDFTNKLKGVLSPQKILLLIEAEHDFRVELMRKVAGFKGRGPEEGKNMKR